MITGVIEGFYGAPWSLADRKACIELLARFEGAITQRPSFRNVVM